MYDINRNPVMLNDFLNYLQSIGKSKQTLKSYAADIRMLLKFIKKYRKIVENDIDILDVEIADIKIQFVKDITYQEIIAYMVFCENELKNTESTRNHKVNAMRKFFQYLYELRIVEYNPVENLKNIKFERKEPDYLTLQESKNLLDTVKAICTNELERDYCIITLFLHCALRISELTEIKMSDLNFDKKQVQILGKGKKYRYVPLNNSAIKALNDYIGVREIIEDKIPGEDRDYLFINRYFRHIDKSGIAKLVKKYCKEAMLDTTKIHTHSLRHTSATLMYKYGKVDIRALQKFLGHKNITTTEIYTHVDNEDIQNAASSNPLNF